MTHGSSFAGIGGMDLGMERAGFETVWQVEIDDYCRKVLEKHFPNAERFRDINECFPELTLLAAGSRALTSRMPANAPELPESIQDSGGQWCVPFAWYDRNTQLWRTWQLCLDGGWAEFLETWPRAGMTRNGIAYRRQPLAPISYATESLSLPKVPSPMAQDSKGARRKRLESGDHYNLRDYFGDKYNLLYPPVAMVEYLLGFPPNYTALEGLGTPSSRRSRNGSGKGLSNAKKS